MRRIGGGVGAGVGGGVGCGVGLGSPPKQPDNEAITLATARAHAHVREALRRRSVELV